MTERVQERNSQSRTVVVLKAYPFGLLLVAILANGFGFGVDPPTVALPSSANITTLILAAVLLLINHTWLMTSTSLVRVRNDFYSTPEEWNVSGKRKEDASEEGWTELERHHNTHRNTTENTIYFVFLAAIFILISPATIVAQVWLTTFPLARLGYSYSFLSGNDNLRGVFMSLSLLAMYGLASYLVMGLLSR